MKIKILLSFLVAGLVFCNVAKAQNTKTDWEKDGLKGKVKSVKTTDYIAVTKTDGDKMIIDKGEVVTHGRNKTTEIVETYDQNGMKATDKTASKEQVDSWTYGDVNSTKMYRYNTDGSLQAGEWKPSSYFYTYRTNAQGGFLERNTYCDGQVQTEVLSKFDLQGNKVSDKSSSQNVVFTYDDKGNKIEKRVSDKDGKILFQYTYYYEFDRTGNWIKCMEMLFANPVKISERIIEYYQ
ncbi:MAG: hypothetical protein LBR17_00300 [Bacteroidales bacterium]|jgi:hypothetical protein|nr:hypothetical protein [Bacteroidales bacterium]